MKRWILTAIFVVVWLSTQAQRVEKLSFRELQPLLNQQNDTTYIVNFWATWCTPCIQELPWFMETARERANQKVRFIFVSLDFPKQMATRLIPFVERNHYNERIILLDETNANSFINQVDKTWSGAIPATLIYKNDKRQFLEQPLSKEELNHWIDQIGK